MPPLGSIRQGGFSKAVRESVLRLLSVSESHRIPHHQLLVLHIDSACKLSVTPKPSAFGLERVTARSSSFFSLVFEVKVKAQTEANNHKLSFSSRLLHLTYA